MQANRLHLIWASLGTLADPFPQKNERLNPVAMVANNSRI